jgi:transposase-like protein
MKCDCGSTKIRKAGKFITRTEGKKQRYLCSECGRTFYEKKENSESGKSL